MPLTTRRLNRALLARQLLLERAPLDVEEGVRRVLALQAQQPASPYLALANRLADFDPAGLDAAFADQRVVKATLLRLTLHAVHADDHELVHRAVQPTLRGSRLADPRFTDSGLTMAEAEALVPALLALLRTPRTTAELHEWIAETTSASDPRGVWWALRCFAPVIHAPTGGAWSFGHRPAYAAPERPPARVDAEAADLALVTLARRYLAAFGPASPADLAQFALVQRTRARAALEVLDGELAGEGGLVRLEGPDGRPLLDLPGAPLPGEDVPAPPRLMAMWDSALLAHADRSRIVPPALRAVVTRRNGDVLPTLLVDGSVAGVWRPVDGGVEATALLPVPEAAWDGLAEEAARLGRLLADRDPRPYRRYDHWWDKLAVEQPDREVRLLPG